MNPEAAGGWPSPQWWWASVVVPIGLTARWLVTFGREGSKSTITGQQELIKSLQRQNEEQSERIEKLEKRLDEQSAEIDERRAEVHALRNQVARLEAQIEIAARK